MTMEKLTALIIALVLFPLACLSQGREPALKIGHKITLQSKNLNESREVWVYLPPNYWNKYFQEQYYPVLYVLEGDLHFHSVSGLIQILGSGVNRTYVIPEMIVVGIPTPDRVRDLIQTHSLVGNDGKEYDFYKSSGGADKLLDFITDELAPKIDSSYRTFPYKILIGQSFGGLTAVHALFTRPESFNAYLAIDPSLWWDNTALLSKSKDYLSKLDLTGRSFYLAQADSRRSWDTGENPHMQAIKELSTLLQKSNSGVRWKYMYYSDDDHSSVAFISEYDALRFFFQKYRTDLYTISTADELKKQFQELSKDLSVKFLPPEMVTQYFGNTYLSIGKYEEAYEFFQMNIDNYPKSSSAYATMGQYWKAKGDKEKALHYYEKSIEILPENRESKNNVDALRKELKKK